MPGKPVPYAGGAGADVAAFDSVPGVGFDSDAAAAAIVPPAGRLGGAGPVLAVDPAQNNAFRAVNRALAAGLDVQVEVRRTADAGDELRYLVPGLSEQDQQALTTSLALAAERTTATGASLRSPRLGLFSVPTSMDAGWTRWVLERYGFQFLHVSGADIESGGLRNRIDVLILSDEPRGILGSGGSTVDNALRVKMLDEFVRGGGTLVCLNRSSLFAIDQLKLPVRNVLGGIGRQEFFSGGSLLRVTTDPAHQVMAGMPADAAVFVQSSPAFETLDGFNGTVLARYPERGPLLLSGYLLGDKHLHGRAAALDVEHGAGRVVLIGFRPQWRGQPFGTFRVLFNAALYRR
jgi:hypothetical protein